MIKLVNILFEDEKSKKSKKKKAKSEPKAEPKEPEKSGTPSLGQLAKHATEPESPPKQSSDPDFLKSVEKGLSKIPREKSPEQKKYVPSLKKLAKNAEKDANKPSDDMPDVPGDQEEHPFGFPNTNEPKKEPKPYSPSRFAIKNEPEPNKSSNVPFSLSNLAKAAELDKNADPTANFPKFQEPEEDPFGEPQLDEPGDFRTGTQKAKDKAKDATKSAFGKGMNALKGLSGKVKGTAQGAMAKSTGKDDDMAGLPAKYQANTDNDMPTLRALSRQRFGKDIFKDTSSKWKVGDIVRIGTADGYRVIRKEPHGWVLTRGNKTYKFIPHSGLHLM